MQILRDPAYPVVVDIEGTNRSYTIRLPLVGDRSTYAVACKKAGARQWQRSQLLQVMAEEASELFEDDAELPSILFAIEHEREKLAEFERAVRAGELEDDEPRTKAYVNLIATSLKFRYADRMLRDYGRLYDKYNLDVEEFERRVAPVAAELFLIGWDGFKEEFERDAKGNIPAHLLAMIPHSDFEAITQLTRKLMEAGPELGNFVELPSGTQSGQKPSNSTSAKTTRSMSAKN